MSKILVWLPLSAQWHTPIMEYLEQHENITAKVAQGLWNVSRRAASSRLKSMCERGLLVEMSTGPKDPYKVFVSSIKHRN